MEIVEHLVKELGVSPWQAQGAAGLLLELVQQRIGSEDFVRVADCLPAISDIIGKAPRVDPRLPSPFRETLSRLCGGLGGMAGLAGAFEKLGCDKTMIRRFADTLISFFHRKGGEEIAALLSGVLR